MTLVGFRLYREFRIVPARYFWVFRRKPHFRKQSIFPWPLLLSLSQSVGISKARQTFVTTGKTFYKKASTSFSSVSRLFPSSMRGDVREGNASSVCYRNLRWLSTCQLGSILRKQTLTTSDGCFIGSGDRERSGVMHYF